MLTSIVVAMYHAQQRGPRSAPSLFLKRQRLITPEARALGIPPNSDENHLVAQVSRECARQHPVTIPGR